MKRSRRHLTTTIWRDQSLADAELLCGSFEDFSYSPHAHDAACVALITRGAIRIRVRCEEFVARDGDIFLANAGEVHAGWPIDAEGWGLRTIYVGLDQLHAWLDSPPAARHSAFGGPMIRDETLTARLLNVHCASQSHTSPLHREEKFADFACWLLEHHARPARQEQAECREPAAVRRAREFLDAHFDQRVSLTEVALAAGLPPFRLLRAFVRAEGLSPHEYQRQLRLRWAMAQMRLGRSLSEVATNAGFADQAHLTRWFRRAMGIPPGAYQRAWAGSARLDDLAVASAQLHWKLDQG